MIPNFMFERKLKKLKKRGERYKREKEVLDTYAEYLPEHKKRKVSNVMLVIIIIAIVGYVVADYLLQYFTGTAMDSTITTCWFGFWTIEIISLTTIKNSKTKHGTNE